MNLITLNVWGGQIHQPLLDFVSKHSVDTDIFCFQEVFSSDTLKGFSNKNAKLDLFQDLSKILGQHSKFHAFKSKGYDYSGFVNLDVAFGNALFIKNTLETSGYKELFEAVIHPHHHWNETAVGKAQFIQIKLGKKQLTLCNFHGLWVAGSMKKDNDYRIKQSEQIKALIDSFEGEKILCGDFNLVPDGKSIAILEQGMENLIKSHHITSTRSALYNKEFKFADYILVSPGVKIKKFEVLQDEVSDHLPLLLEFEL